MKINTEHFNIIKTKIEVVLHDEPDRIEKYETGNFYRSDRVKNLQVRFNWDLFHDAGLTIYACNHLYKYANDDHIWTALKRICPKVTDRYSM